MVPRPLGPSVPAMQRSPRGVGQAHRSQEEGAGSPSSSRWPSRENWGGILTWARDAHTRGELGFSASQTNRQWEGPRRLLLQLEGYPTLSTSALPSSLLPQGVGFRLCRCSVAPAPLAAVGQVSWVWPGCGMTDPELEGLSLPHPTLPSMLLRHPGPETGPSAGTDGCRHTEPLVLILWPEAQREALSLAQHWGTLCLSSDPTQAPHQVPDLSQPSDPAHNSHTMDPAQLGPTVLNQSQEP